MTGWNQCNKACCHPVAGLVFVVGVSGFGCMVTSLTLSWRHRLTGPLEKQMIQVCDFDDAMNAVQFIYDEKCEECDKLTSDIEDLQSDLEGAIDERDDALNDVDNLENTLEELRNQ